MRAAMRFVVAEGGLAVFGPFRDIVRCFEDADHGTVVHHNLGLGITAKAQPKFLVQEQETECAGIPSVPCSGANSLPFVRRRF